MNGKQFYDAVPFSEKNVRTSVALGIFDGVHQGHRKVISRAVCGKNYGLTPVVFTFSNGTVYKKGKKLSWILSDERKAEKMHSLGVEKVISPDFLSLKEMSAEDFVKEILVERLHCERAVCGSDFRFGKNASGDCRALKKFSEKYGFSVEIVEPFVLEGEIVSSSLIRKLLEEGNIKKANRFLGSSFEIEAQVVHGAEIGRTWNFPTVNQILPDGQEIPKFGVYCVKVLIDGEWHEGVCNVGVKPTVGAEKRPLAETYILNYSGDLYGRVLRLAFFEFIREERKFSSLEELKNEIALNKEFAEKYFKQNNSDI